MRVVVAFVFCVGLALTAATSVSDRLLDSQFGTIPATQLGSSMGSSSHHHDCLPPQPTCQQHVSFNSDAGGAGGAGGVDDALKPVEDWIKDFKKRTSGAGGNDLYRAAKGTWPLLLSLPPVASCALRWCLPDTPHAR